MSYTIIYAHHAITHPEASLDGRQLYMPVYCAGDNNCYEDISTGRRARRWYGRWVGCFDQVLIEMIEQQATATCGEGLRRAKERVTHPEQLIRAWRKKLQQPLDVRQYHEHGISVALTLWVDEGAVLPCASRRLLERLPSREERGPENQLLRTGWEFSLDDPENWVAAARLRAHIEQCRFTVDVSGPRV